MKILRFTEDIEHSTHINNKNQEWSENKIEEIYSDLEDLSNLITGYLIDANKENMEGPTYRWRMEEFWFDGDEDEYFTAHFKDLEHERMGKHRNIRHEFSKTEFEELLVYMNNPDMFRDSKKYNL